MLTVHVLLLLYQCVFLLTVSSFAANSLPHIQRAVREQFTGLFQDDWSPAEVKLGCVNYVSTTLRSESVV
jgi:hypothetical protein